MKIVQLLPYAYPLTGGLETFVHDLSKEFIRLGHEIHIIASPFGINISPDLLSTRQVDGVFFYPIPVAQALNNKKPSELLRCKLLLDQKLREINADILHLHIGGFSALYYRLSAVAQKLPMVVTVHDLLENEEKSDTTLFVLRHAEIVTAISQARLMDLRKMVPERAAEFRLLYDSRPLSITPVKTKLAKTPTVLMVGRHVKTKGFEFGLEVFQRILSEIADAHLIIVGKGPLTPRLMKLAESLGIKKQVTFTGRVSDEELSMLYRRAWVSWVPSQHSESFGLVALEAMFAGCPVIASRVGGLQEVVLHEKTGFVLDAHDYHAWVEASLPLLRDPGLREQMGTAGRHRAETVFSWQKCVDAYETIYKYLADNSCRHFES